MRVLVACVYSNDLAYFVLGQGDSKLYLLMFTTW